MPPTPIANQARLRLTRHEAAHATVGWLVGFRSRLVRVGAESGGLVDLLPDYRARPEYLDPSLACFPLFLCAGVDDFPGGIYAGPLPSTLPSVGARAVADVIAILLAGYAVDPGDAADNYGRGLEVEGSDAQQIEMLVGRYPATVLVRNRLLGFLPGLLAGLRSEVEAVAAALVNPTDEAAASWLGNEDLDRLRAGFNRERFTAMAWTLGLQLDAMALLVERGWRDAA